MLQSSIFQWQQGAGWFVLSSGHFLNGETEAIDTRMLNRCDTDGPLVYIGAAHDEGLEETYLNYLYDLGSRSGYMVDIIAEDDETLSKQIGEAGVIIIGDGPYADRLYNGLQGPASEAIRAAYTRGALVMGNGIGAELFGDWVLRLSTNGLVKGLGWLSNAILLTDKPGKREKAIMQSLLQDQPISYGLGIMAESALVFGPEGQVELWGKQQISISLGQGYSIQE